MQSNQALNSKYSCLTLLSAQIMGVHHYTRQQTLFSFQRWLGQLILNTDCRLDRIRSQLGDQFLSMLVREFLHWAN